MQGSSCLLAPPNFSLRLVLRGTDIYLAKSSQKYDETIQVPFDLDILIDVCDSSKG